MSHSFLSVKGTENIIQMGNPDGCTSGTISKMVSGIREEMDQEELIKEVGALNRRIESAISVNSQTGIKIDEINHTEKKSTRDRNSVRSQIISSGKVISKIFLEVL